MNKKYVELNFIFEGGEKFSFKIILRKIGILYFFLDKEIFLFMIVYIFFYIYEVVSGIC